jgi:uncharacterized protein (TIGR02996 family)
MTATDTSDATASSVEDALLQDILREPDDDGLRLILADYLEDHGDPERASFIRDQVELEKRAWHKLAPVLNRVREYILRRGGDEARRLCPAGVWYLLGISSDNQQDWERGQRMGVALYGSPPSVELYFRRGFVWRVHCRCVYWKDHGPALVRKSPIRHVYLTDVGVTRHRNGLGTVHPESRPWPWMRHKDSITNRSFATVEKLRAALSEEVLEWARTS